MFSERAQRSAVFILALLVVAQQPFDNGARAYEAGDYREAAAAFEQQTTAHPADTAVWFNLVNAQFRAGEKGRAFHAWATALRLEPRNEDIVHNLRAAGNVEALRVRPPLAVRAEEWLLLAALLWWIGAAFIILAVARRQSVPRWVIAPLILAVVFAVTGWVAARPPRFAIALPQQAALQSEPTIRSTLVRNVRTGAVLTIEEERGEWLRVETIDKRNAWVARDDVAEITFARNK